MRIFRTLYKILLKYFPSLFRVDLTIEVVTQEQQFPAETVSGLWKIYIEKNDSQTHYYEGPNSWVTFTDVTPGTYIAYGVRVDADDNILGDIVTAEIDVSPNLYNIYSNGINISCKHKYK